MLYKLKKKGNHSGGAKSDNLKLMDEKYFLETAKIDENDGETTPGSVRNRVVNLMGKIEQLEKYLQELREISEKLAKIPA